MMSTAMDEEGAGPPWLRDVAVRSDPGEGSAVPGQAHGREGETGGRHGRPDRRAEASAWNFRRNSRRSSRHNFRRNFRHVRPAPADHPSACHMTRRPDQPAPASVLACARRLGVFQGLRPAPADHPVPRSRRGAMPEAGRDRSLRKQADRPRTKRPLTIRKKTVGTCPPPVASPLTPTTRPATLLATRPALPARGVPKGLTPLSGAQQSARLHLHRFSDGIFSDMLLSPRG